MASVRRTPAGAWELTIRHRLLPRPRYFTFDTQTQAEDYGRQVDEVLRRGVVPEGLRPLAASPVGLSSVLRAWLATGRPAATDQPVLELLIEEQGKVALVDVTITWAEDWVQALKVGRNLAPGTIRKRVGSLRRALDWHLRQHPALQWSNPLRLLAGDYSAYSPEDGRQVAAAGGDIRRDVQRDRRLQPGELERIEAALAGVKRPERERGLKSDLAFTLLFRLVLHTGVRLREAYRLRCDDVDLKRRVLTVQSSKQRHGREKIRHVPIRRELHADLASWVPGRAGLLLPCWDGDADSMDAVTGRLSARFASLFAYAECVGLTEHDLRHEATCRWLEERDAAGGWLFRAEEIPRLMGWAPGSRMLERYASFRAEDLAGRLWGDAP
jgi:integrase